MEIGLLASILLEFISNFAERLPVSVAMISMVLLSVWILIRGFASNNQLMDKLFMYNIQENNDAEAKNAEKHIKRYIKLVIVFYILALLIAIGIIVIAIVGLIIFQSRLNVDPLIGLLTDSMSIIVVLSIVIYVIFNVVVIFRLNNKHLVNYSEKNKIISCIEIIGFSFLITYLNLIYNNSPIIMIAYVILALPTIIYMVWTTSFKINRPKSVHIELNGQPDVDCTREDFRINDTYIFIKIRDNSQNLVSIDRYKLEDVRKWEYKY